MYYVYVYLTFVTRWCCYVIDKSVPSGFFTVSACVFSFHSFSLCHRMFVVSYSPLHLLDLVASHCRLSYHGYLREVGGDGSVLGGVELEIAVVQEGPAPTHFFPGRPCCLVRSLRSRNRPGPERSLDACAWSSCRLLFPPRPTTGLCLSLSSNSNLTAESRWALYFSTLHSYWRWWYCAILEFSTIRADLFYFRHPRFCWELEDYILGRFFDSWILDLISHDPIQVLAVLMLVDSFEYK
jgi:hypothetical protein